MGQLSKIQIMHDFSKKIHPMHVQLWKNTFVIWRQYSRMCMS